MPTPPTSKFAIPESAEEFDKIATDVAGRIYKCRFQRNGRSGQAQEGVDAYAMPSAGAVIGLQHKNVEELTIAKVRSETKKAEDFEPPLSEFAIMTTDTRDADLQREVRKLTAARLTKNLFPVSVLFWEDICEEISGHEDLLKKHFPHLWGELAADKAKQNINITTHNQSGGVNIGQLNMRRPDRHLTDELRRYLLANVSKTIPFAMAVSNTTDAESLQFAGEIGQFFLDSGYPVQQGIMGLMVTGLDLSKEIEIRGIMGQPAVIVHPRR